MATINGTFNSLIGGTISGTVGTPGPAGPAGPAGPQGIPGVGVPAGGLEGQVLLKASDTSYDTAWFDNYAATVQATVRNETGATLSKGTVVYISGGAGNKPLVQKASASSEASSSKTFAILAQDIPTNSNGQAVTMGLLKGVDTSAFTAGANLWLSTTAGQIVSPTPPATPAHAVFLGNVVRVHANQGEIEVRIQNGYELGELHDVLLDTPANGQVLKYDSAQGLWINGNALTSVAWGEITGTLSDQTDLQSALDAKQSVSGMSAYLTKADNLASVASTSSARSNLGLGSLDTPTFAGVTAQGSGSNVANLTPTSLSLTHATSGSFTIQPSVGITFPDASVQTTAFTGIPAAYISSVSSPLSVSAGNLSIDLSSYLTTSAAASTYYPLTNPSGYITSSALSGYATESWVTAGFYPLSGNPSGFLTSSSLTGYATESWVTSQGYLTSAPVTSVAGRTGAITLSTSDISGLGTLATVNDAPSDGSQYARKDGAWEVVSVPASYITSVSSPLSVSAGDLSIDLSAYETTASAAATYYPLSNPLGFTTAYQSDLTYLKQSYNLSDLTNVSDARTNLGLGTMATATAADYSTTSAANALYYPLSSNPSGYLTSASLSGYATESWVTSALGSYLTTATAASTYLTQSNAASTYQTLSGMSSYLTTSTAASTYAPLASPALTGTPTAPTATGGTNTTQIATTAFVQQEVPAASTTTAGKVELATTTEALQPSSSTLAMTPDTTREMMLYPGYVQMFGGGNYSTSGTGAANFVNGSQRWTAQRSPNATIAGYAMYIFDYSFSGFGMAAMTRGVSSIGRKWNSKIWVSGRSVLGQYAEATSGLNGDANCTARVMLGGRSSVGTGGMVAAENGIGWRVAGGGSVAMVMTVSNGSTLTETTSSFTPVLGEVFDWKMYSDGTGNVTLWINDSQVATSTGGPTTSTTENYNFYCQVCEQTASATAPLAMGNFGTKVFWSPA